MKNNNYALKTLGFIALAFFLFNTYGQAQPKLHFVAYGDSRDDQATFSKVCKAVETKKPEVVLFSGDLTNGTYTYAQWFSSITANASLGAALNANKFLVAWGNHESCSAVQGLSPTVLRGGTCTYSFTEGNCFFVCMGEDPALNTTWLETQLKSAASQSAKWRIIFHHYCIYSAGGHPTNGVTAYEALCDKYNVAFSIAGHDHCYQRSKVMFGKAVVFTGKVIPATQKGTSYLVSGGAGAPLYSVSTASWQEKSVSDNNFLEFSAYDDSMRVNAYTGNGALIESFVRGRFDLATNVDELNPQNEKLLNPKPSIFSASTSIEYSLDQPGKVEISILDVSGRLIKTLVNGNRPSGLNSVDWNGDNNSGNRVSPGIYFCKMISEQYSISEKLVFTK